MVNDMSFVEVWKMGFGFIVPFQKKQKIHIPLPVTTQPPKIGFRLRNFLSVPFLSILSLSFSLYLSRSKPPTAVFFRESEASNSSLPRIRVSQVSLVRSSKQSPSSYLCSLSLCSCRVLVFGFFSEKMSLFWFRRNKRGKKDFTLQYNFVRLNQGKKKKKV